MTTLQKTIRALLIDDHALFRESVSEALTEPGFAIEHCATIQEGIRLLADHHFDIVLLDHDLGTQRASLFLPTAREAGLDVRVLVVTAWISDNEARRLLQQGREDRDGAEALMQRSIETARRQGALSWELRTAIPPFEYSIQPYLIGTVCAFRAASRGSRLS